jgi:BolA protein
MGQIADRMTSKLEAAFAPTRLEVKDDSHLHQGHAGHREGGESHFTVVIESGLFTGLGRVERQRRINHALAEELSGPVHALSIKATAPGE